MEAFQAGQSAIQNSGVSMADAVEEAEDKKADMRTSLYLKYDTDHLLVL